MWVIVASNTMSDAETVGQSVDCRVRLPFSAGDELTVALLPHDEPTSDRPFWLVNEILTDAAPELTSAVGAVMATQGTDSENAFCYVVHSYLSFVEWVRARQNALPLLEEDHYRASPQWRLNPLDDSYVFGIMPATNLERVLHFWRNVGCRFPSGLPSVKRFRDGQLSYTTIPPQVVRRTERRDPARCYMRHVGKSWTVAFQGESRQLRESKGLAFIALLLARPRTPIEAWELDGMPEQLWVGLTEEATTTDDETRADLRRRLTAKPNHVLNDSEKEEAENIALFLSKETRLGGRSREFTGAREQLRKRVSANFLRAYAKIEEAELQDLAQHLRRHIQGGFSYTYDPPEDIEIDWEISS